MTNSNHNNLATLIHLSSFSQLLFPFGNFIAPAILWSMKKNESELIDYSGKQVLNFQLSTLLYTILFFAISIPIGLYVLLKRVSNSGLVINSNNIESSFDSSNLGIWFTVGIVALVIFGLLKLVEFALIIYAAVKTSNGEKYKYPLTINFIK